MTIGDIFAVIAAVALIGAGWGATLLIAALALSALSGACSDMYYDHRDTVSLAAGDAPSANAAMIPVFWIEPATAWFQMRMPAAYAELPDARAMIVPALITSPVTFI